MSYQRPNKPGRFTITPQQEGEDPRVRSWRRPEQLDLALPPTESDRRARIEQALRASARRRFVRGRR